MESQDSCRPVPAPRRLYPELRKTDYENVTVELINKNLNINSENIHTTTNCTEKVPNNKVFLVTTPDSDEINANKRSVLTETNDLYGPNANENVPAPPIYNEPSNTPKPAPRPRKPQNTDLATPPNDIYENTQSAVSRSSPVPQPSNYAANKGVLRKAPELPPKSYLNVDRSTQRYSFTSEVSTTSSVAGGYDLSESNFPNTNTSKSSSSVTLNSNDSKENAKFKSPSPGDILKSLGTTSKLLGESIGERVALKAKVVKHKLDKNLKGPTEMLTETGNRLKNVGRHFNTNFTLSKKDKDKNKDTSPTQFHTDRPQTLPPNDQVFNTISFSSPLNRKATGVQNLSGSMTDCSYEVPRSVKLAHSDLDISAPPSYEDALKSPSNGGFSRNASGSRSLMVPRHIANEAAHVALSKQRSNNSLQNVVEEHATDNSSSRDSLDVPSLPMPTFPPPALPKELANDTEAIYGRINPVQPPARQRRRKNYEQIQLRRALDNPSPVSGTSLRPNVDSAELHQLNIEAAKAEREESMLLRQQNLVAESQTPKPERSESWEYFQDNAEESAASSPEPLYANEDATYGRVFTMATTQRNVLAPQGALQQVSEESAQELRDCEGAVGGWVKPPEEIIQEFDPLSGKTLKICNAEKSNQLLLLEHLLEEDVYGTVTGGEGIKSDDDISMGTSDEDNSTIALNQPDASTSKVMSEQKPLTVVLPTPTDKPAKADPSASNIQIVHQNARLLSDSMENMLDDEEERRVRPYLSRTNERPDNNELVDLARPSENRTHWFVDDAKDSNVSTRVNPFDKLNIENEESPPSYLEAIGADGRPQGGDQKSRTSRFMNTISKRVGALTRKSSFKIKSSDVRVTLQMVPRPSLSPLLVRYEGPLVRFPSGVVEDILKEMQNRKAILRDRQFQTFLDLDMKTPKEILPLEYITTVQCVSNSRVTDNSTHFYCFEITVSMPKNVNTAAANMQVMSNPNLVMTNTASGNHKHQRVSHLYGVSKESERGIWMQKILESLTNAIPLKYVCRYYRAGWCYLKHSITSEWSGTWVVLKKHQRRLIFATEATMNVEKMDLRKARCIVLKDSDESIRNLHVEAGPMLMIDCPPYTVYMIMSSPRETKVWRHIIREVAHNNGSLLSDQQLTKFNVPVIVDKCINFVYIHGSMSEGIYRKSGSENSIAKLLAAFRADAFNVEITRNEYNEHDVANALKRFMRDLPERLMGKLSDSFMCVTGLSKAADKIHSYKELLERLSVIERETLKKIVGHLAFISSQKSKNKMSIKNLTMIWGPTLLQNNQHQEEMVYSQQEADVLTDLIVLYKELFPLSLEEMKKEQEMLMCLQKYYAAAERLTDSVKKSGDLKMWIILNPKPENTNEEKTQVSVTISPTKTAYEICKELASKMQMSTHQLSLHEVILNDSLERPLHHDTKVFDVVLNWSYWPEDDRKNNYLVVKPVDVLREVQRAVKNLATLTPSKELKFADNRTKAFKMYLCELRDGKIVISKKDKNEKTTIVREIFLHSTTAYLGCEKKRDFPWSWAITFVERTQTQILRSREAPYIGHVLAGSEWVDRTIWLASIWYCLHGDSILPPAEIIMK